MFKRTGAWLFGLSIVTAGFMASVLAAPPLPGAIFTTDVNGTQVNGNVYENCTDVYLNGGPPPNAPCSAAGLPDGCYCYQVTDPSGKVLLSLDDISNRGLQDEGALIVHDNGNHGVGDHDDIEIV